jgi:hypothetical protein
VFRLKRAGCATARSISSSSDVLATTIRALNVNVQRFHLDSVDGTRVSPADQASRFDQRCGNSSSMRLLGCLAATC